MGVKDVKKTHLPKQKKISWYFVYIFLVLPIISVIPLAFLYVGSSATVLVLRQLELHYEIASSRWWSSIFHYCFLVWASIEVVFYFVLDYLHRKYTHIQKGRPSPRRPSKAYLRELLEKCVDATEEEEQEDQFTKWFYRAPLDTIGKDNVREWVAWTLFSKNLDELSSDNVHGEDEHEVVEEITEFFEERNLQRLYEGFRFPDGRNPNVKSMRLSLDPVRKSTRPFIFYAVVNSLNYLAYIFFTRLGFVFHRHQGIDYYVYIPPTYDPAKVPFMFVHGIGIGLITYLPFILELRSHVNATGRPLCLVSLPHVSMSIFHKYWIVNPPRDDVVKWINEALRGNHAQAVQPHRGAFKNGVCLISHSVGSVVGGWLVKHDEDEAKRLGKDNYKPLVQNSVFVDPVVLRLWEADVCLNFVYADTFDGEGLFSRFLIAGELGISKFLGREFWWWECVVFREQVGWDKLVSTAPPPSSIVYLAQGDRIIDADRVNEYLTQPGDSDFRQLCQRENAADEAAHFKGLASDYIETWDGPKTPRLRTRYIPVVQHGELIIRYKHGRREILRAAERLACNVKA